jgi:tryptophan synthase beta chain
MVTKYENLNPSLEPSHAFAEAIKIAPKVEQRYYHHCELLWGCKKRPRYFKRKIGQKIMASLIKSSIPKCKK